MRLTTIWTLPAASLREKAARTVDWAAQTAAAALPRRVRYWAAIQSIATAIADHPGEVPAIPLGELLNGLDGGPR